MNGEAESKELLDDVTVTIPVRIDSPDRARNVRLSASYLLGQFDCPLVIAEEGENVLLLLEEWAGCFRHLNCGARADGLFWKTRLLNAAAREASTPLILSYDADVLVPTAQLKEAAEWLRKGEADMVYPFDGTLMDMPKYVSRLLEQDQKWDRLDPALGVLRTRAACVGGALMMNHEKFVACGMENERFAGWGGEDNERHWRFTKLGMKMLRTGGSICHLFHDKGESKPAEQAYYRANEAEYARIFAMNREQLEAEVQRGLHTES